ncbi:MAG: LamG-like jellyroll fold domain-containing protein [Sedimentisphaeraceae bacterium JB056]
MFKMINIIVLLCVALSYAAPTSSPWDHQGSELSQSVTITPGTSPITYTSAFTREREIYGYNPRFMPLPVVFDKDNRPFILTAVPPGNTVGSIDSFYTGSERTEEAFIQTLDDNGNWVTYSITDDIMRSLYSYTQYAGPEITAGYKWEDRIFFDDDNNIRFTMISEAPDVSGTVLVYSEDGMETWKSLHLNYIYNTSVESFDTFSASEYGLPTICHAQTGDSGNKELFLCKLAKDPMGNFMFDQMVNIVGEEGKFGPGHSGYLNYTLTIGDRIHYFWMDQLNQAPGEETRQYHNYYDTSTGFVSTPTFLGSTVGTWYGDAEPYVPVDPHNGPSATVDRNKTIHVVLGGHGTQAKYTYSTDNGDSWEPVTNLPGGNVYNTYPTLITDRENTVHMAYRATLSPGSYQLAYARKAEGQPWEDMGALVQPGNDGYSVYYHTMTVDRLGRLFLQYYYRADTMSEADKAEYRAKWPSQPDPDVEIYTHDPVIIMSDNGGDTWKIATTQDFADGLIDDTKPVAVYNFDGGNLGYDMAGGDNSLTTAYGAPVSVSGLVGNAADFDGSSALAGSLDQAQEITDGAFTVTGWFKLASAPSALSNLVNAKTGQSGFALMVNNGQWIGYTYADGYNDSVVSSAATTAGQWTHIAFTYMPAGEPDASGVYTGTSKLYVDGSLVAEAAGKKYAPTGSKTIAVASSTLGTDFFGCTVDELGVFAGAMPAAKIKELAANIYIPSNVSRELFYQGDLNNDGFVDISDYVDFVSSWLVSN